MCKAKDTNILATPEWEKPLPPMSDGHLIYRIYNELKTEHEENNPIRKRIIKLNRILKDQTHMAKKYQKKCSSSIGIMEMQIKTTLRYFLTPVKISKINTANDSTC